MSLQGKTTELNGKVEKVLNANIEDRSKSESTNLYLLNKEKARNKAKSKKLESKIEELEKDIKHLNEILGSPEVCRDYIKVMDIQKSIYNKSTELEKLMEEWLKIN